MKKTILITGANGGLGSEVVEYFHQTGFEVIAIVRPGKANKKIPDGARVVEAIFDTEEEAKKLVESINQPIHAACLLAGGFAMKKFENTSTEDLREMINKNFNSAFFLSQQLLLHMKKYQTEGKMIFIGAKTALEKGGAATTAYAISKVMLKKLSEIINETGAKDNVSAAFVAPSIINTPANREAMPSSDFGQWVSPRELASIMKFIIDDPGSMKDVVIKAYKGQ